MSQYSQRSYPQYYRPESGQYSRSTTPQQQQWSVRQSPSPNMASSMNPNSNHHQNQPSQQRYQPSSSPNLQQQQQQSYYSNSNSNNNNNNNNNNVYYRSTSPSAYGSCQQQSRVTTINSQQQPQYQYAPSTANISLQQQSYPIYSGTNQVPPVSYSNHQNYYGSSAGSNPPRNIHQQDINNNNNNANRTNSYYGNSNQMQQNNPSNIVNPSNEINSRNGQIRSQREQQSTIQQQSQHVSPGQNPYLARTAFDTSIRSNYSKSNINSVEQIRMANGNDAFQFSNNTNNSRPASKQLSIPKPMLVHPAQNYRMTNYKDNNQNKSFSQDSAIKKTHTNNNNIHLRQALGLVNLESNEKIIENTKPVFKKFKIINIGQVDHSKILLSLKSGLLAEATWALDCLNVLSKNGSLRINHVPNILEYLMEYYKCFLDTIFDDLFADTESDFQMKLMAKRKRKLQDMVDVVDENEQNYQGEFQKLIERGEKTYLLDSTNYTFKSRNGLMVKLKKDDNFNQVINGQYSCWEDSCDYNYFQNGNTLSTSHIIQTMEPLQELIPFIKNQYKCDKNSLESIEKVIKSEDDFKIYQPDNEAEKYETEINKTLAARRESLELLIKRCLCVSSIIRNLSFLPENARSMAENASLILMLARLLTFYHKHCAKKSFADILQELENKSPEKENKEVREIFNEFAFETLHMIRMNSFVTLSNMSEFLDLSNFTENIILPLLDSLLHWAVCQSSYARDNLPPDNLSCQIQSLEIMAKLSIHEPNIDLILATPPFDRIENLFKVLVQLTGKEEDQVLRELSLVVLSNFVRNDILSARIVMHIDYSISNLLGFIEQQESFNRESGMCASKHSPLSYDHDQLPINCMLKHAAIIMRTFANCEQNCEQNDLDLIQKYEERLVDLTMSMFLDAEVTHILADLVFILSNRKSK